MDNVSYSTRALQTNVLDAAALNSSPPATDTATVLRAIVSWIDLPARHRQALLTAVNHVEEMYQTNREVLAGAPLWSCEGLNRLLFGCPYQIYGLSQDAFRNSVSGLRTILTRLGLHADSRYGRNTLTPAWQALHEQVPTAERKRSLIRFFRYMTLEGIAPDTVEPETIDRFGDWCASRILCDDPAGMSRRAASNWQFARKSVPGWPQVELRRADMRDQYVFPLTAFPGTFQSEVNRFLSGLANGRGPMFPSKNPYSALAKTASNSTNDRAGPRGAPRALKARTVGDRDWQIRAAATSLVLSDVLGVEQILSLSTLVRPIENLMAVLNFHRNRLSQRWVARGVEHDDDDLKSSNLRGIGEVLRQIAKFEVRMPPAELDEVMAYVSAVTPPEQVTMTETNRRKLRILLADPVRTKLLHLPDSG